MLGNVRTFAKLGSPFASMVNWASATKPVRMLNEAIFGIDHRRTLPALSGRTFVSQVRNQSKADASVLLFNDTFTNFYDPEIGLAAWDVLDAAGLAVGLAPNHCCGRPQQWFGAIATFDPAASRTSHTATPISGS